MCTCICTNVCNANVYCLVVWLLRHFTTVSETYAVNTEHTVYCIVYTVYSFAKCVVYIFEIYCNQIRLSFFTQICYQYFFYLFATNAFVNPPKYIRLIWIIWASNIIATAPIHYTYSNYYSRQNELRNAHWIKMFLLAKFRLPRGYN